MPFTAILSVLKGLIIVPVGIICPFSLEDNPFKTMKALMDYVQDRELGARASDVPKFILVVSSSDTWIVVSDLEIA